MIRVMNKCALLAAAIAAVAAIVGLEIHATIILIVVALCILVLVVGGPPNDLEPWWGGRSEDRDVADKVEIELAARKWGKEQRDLPSQANRGSGDSSSAGGGFDRGGG